jgi:fluoride exporter
VKLHNVLAVGVGGALGSITRYLVQVNLLQFTEFPFSTMIVNILGSLFLGILTGVLHQIRTGEWVKLSLGVGFCGGFTTMSTFAADIFQLSSMSFFAVISYFSITLLGGLSFALIGYVIGLNFCKNKKHIERRDG